jgi:poly(A) polymerase
MKTAEKKAHRIVAQLQQAGHTAYLAGGCVRDHLLGRQPKDYDIATDAKPEEIQALFSKTLDIGAAFGAVVVVDDGIPFDVTTFRSEAGYTDNRHPEAVTFTDAKADARRRDFTVNGLFYDTREDTVIDYVDGRKDLEAHLIRAIGDPAERFNEDYLRMLRAVRFAATLDFSIEDQTATAIRQAAHHITSISAERVRDELVRLLVEAPRSGDALLMLRSCGLLEHILPEVEAMSGQEQPPEFHPEGDVLTHTVMMLNSMTNADTQLAFAVLLHDVGKPPTAKTVREDDGSERIRFDRHANVGADMAEDILRRLRFSRSEIEAITTCIRGHMRFMDVQSMRDATLRRLIGRPTFETELELHRLDCLCSHGALDNYAFLEDFRTALRNAPVLPPPWISGHDIMKLGVREGPRVGHWLRVAYEAQLNTQFGNREELLAWLKEQIPSNAD